ncbi:MAG: type II toxin-antitoxin system prevent-host-death family antitoxin [Burkholderiales bacterium]|nr:type II toxin-antitoxin system prevent-host-death family antitoxin [Burkholderiales bacterium]
MDKRMSIAQAKDQLTALVRAAERGEVVTVTRRGKPVARVLSESGYRRILGRRRRAAWSAPVLDTSRFRFDRDEANRR